MARTPHSRAGRRAAAVLGLTVLALLAGCANNPKNMPLYGWRGYENNLDAYFRADKVSTEDQLKAMQDDKLRMEAERQHLPPGYLAHMGLLHGRSGDLDSFRMHIEAEKKNFPESAGFMDFLLRNFKKN